MKKKYFLGIQLCYVVTGILIIGSTIRNNIGYSIGDTVLAEKIEEQYAVRENDIQNTGVVPSGTEDEETEQTMEAENERGGASIQEQQEITKKEDSEKVKSEKEDSDAEQQPQKVFQKVDKSYLNDALFIGDSRTLGLMEYGGVSQASFFADSGMTVFDLEKTIVPVAGYGKTDIRSLLKQKKFGKIYFMMGINEAGYPWKTLEKKYKETVAMIRDMQPDALIFLCANLMMTEEKSGQSKAINNKVICKINAMIEKLASKNEMYYIDVNEIFTDKKGNLCETYSNDGVHVLGKYYRDWMDWICTKGVV